MANPNKIRNKGNISVKTPETAATTPPILEMK